MTFRHYNKPDMELLAAPMRHRVSQAHHLSSEIYSSPQVIALESEKIFMTHWLCAGREEEISKVGDYMTLKILGEPILITRHQADSITAFWNRCAHRGVEVASGCGNTRSFRCPYHAWNFNLSGKLIGAPHMKQSEADLSELRLKPVHVATWRGWIFVNLSADPEPFQRYIETYEKALWFFRTDQCKLASKIVVDVACNWKYLCENLLDVYHVRTLHAKTFGQHLADAIPDTQFLPRGGVSWEFEAAPLAVGGKQDFATLPWLTDRGIGFSGKAAMFPNMNISARVDSLRMWVLWPLSETHTQIHNYQLFPEASFHVPDYDKKFSAYQEYVRQVIAEDQMAVESLQRLGESHGFQPGPLSHLEEAIHHLLNHYLDVMTS